MTATMTRIWPQAPPTRTLSSRMQGLQVLNMIQRLRKNHCTTLVFLLSVLQLQSPLGLFHHLHLTSRRGISDSLRTCQERHPLLHRRQRSRLLRTKMRITTPISIRVLLTRRLQEIGSMTLRLQPHLILKILRTCIPLRHPGEVFPPQQLLFLSMLHRPT